MAVLLLASTAVMLYYARKTVKEETLQKAAQTLESTVQCVDNILLCVEQASGNLYFTMLPHLSQPEMMYAISRQLLEANPYINGCAIAFKPGFYPGRDLFMAYYHREASDDVTAEPRIVRSETFANEPYTQQLWYTKPMETGRTCWQSPLEESHPDVTPLITFSLPIYGADGKPVGVMGVDVELSLLSTTVLASKPSAHSYGMMLDRNGSYLVHPDSTKLLGQTVFEQFGKDADPSIIETAQTMVSGQTGYKAFTMDKTDYIVFYKPFQRTAVPGRAMEALNWSIGIVYPEHDIFGDYNKLLYYLLIIVFVGLILIFQLSRIIIHRQLKPLNMLTASAQRIATGDYNAIIPDSHQEDEIGRLQDNFQKMQQALVMQIGELEQLTTTLQERNDSLHAAYNHAQKAERMKIAFLQNMTNQMVVPAEAISNDVNTLCKKKCGSETSGHEGGKDTVQLLKDIHQNGNTITELLNNLLHIADKEITIGVNRPSKSKKGGTAHD